MSEHLSEDATNWPHDPYVLLGVSRDTDERTLRRAYTSLIRRFRPEHHPQEFQRIREAYEQVQQNLAFPGSWDALTSPTGRARQFDQWPTRHAVEDSSRRDSSQRDSDSSAKHSKPANHDTRQSAEAVPDFEVLLATGDPALALRDHEARFGEHPDVEEAALQRYWLLKLQPTNDDEHVFDWLAAQAFRHSGQEKVLACLRQEVAWDSDLARRDSLAWLAGEDVSQDRFQDILAARWRSAAVNGGWSLIADELRQIEERDRLDAQDSWAAASVTVMNLLLWGGQAQHKELRRLRDVLVKCEELQLRLPHIFDALDELDALLSELQSLSVELSEFVRPLLRAAGLYDRRVYSRQVWLMARRLAEGGVKMLPALRQLATQTPFAFGRLFSVLAEANGYRAIEFRSEHGQTLSRLAEQLISSTNWATEVPDFTDIIRFCTEYGVPVDILSMLVYENATIPEHLRTVAAQTLYNNLPLALLIEASQVYRSGGEV